MSLFTRIRKLSWKIAIIIRRRMNNYKYGYRHKELGHDMKVNLIIPSESPWILYKFAESTGDQLKKLGIEVNISKEFDTSADINHSFTASTPAVISGKCSFMVAHISRAELLDSIVNATKKDAVAICMSRETRDMLIASGAKRNRICYVNPAQDGQITPKKITLGFTHRVYSDNRKRESMILDICKEIDPNVFRFEIMGAGWESIISEMEKMGFEVKYFSEFDKEEYNKLMLRLDYYCYFGFDEGSMGYLDAVAAGVGTIVTPQGYHLDTECEITYPVSTINEIVDALQSLQEKRKKHYRFIETWTWENYAKKHLEIWKYMLGCEDLNTLLSNRGWYQDGIFSLMLDNLSEYEPLGETIKRKLSKGDQ